MKYTLRISRLFLCSFGLAWLSAFAQEGDLSSRWRAEHLSGVVYHLRLSFEEGSAFFAGQADINFDLNLKDALQRQQPLSLEFAEGVISFMTLNGNELPVKEYYNGQSIVLPAQWLRHGSNQFVVRYQHAYSERDGLRKWSDPVDQRTYIYSSPNHQTLSSVMPAFTQSDILATFAINVITPPEWTVSFANSKATLVQTKTARTWDFKPTPPLNPLIWRFAAGNFMHVSATLPKLDATLLLPQSMVQPDTTKNWRDLVGKLHVVAGSRNLKWPQQWLYAPIPLSAINNHYATSPDHLRDWLWSKGADTRMHLAALQDLLWSGFAMTRSFANPKELIIWQGWQEFLSYWLLASSEKAGDRYLFTFFTDIKIPLAYQSFEPYIGRATPSESEGGASHDSNHDYNSGHQHIAALLFRQWAATDGINQVMQKMNQLDTPLPGPGLKLAKDLPVTFSSILDDALHIPKINATARCDNGVWKRTEIIVPDGAATDNGLTSRAPFTIYSFAALKGLQAQGKGTINLAELRADQPDSPNLPCPYLILVDDQDDYIVNSTLQGEQIKHALTLLQKNMSPVQQGLIVRKIFEQFADGRWPALDFFQELLPFLQNPTSGDVALALLDWMSPLIGGPNYLQFIPESPAELAEAFRSIYEQWEATILEKSRSNQDSRLTLAWLRAAAKFVRSPGGLQAIKLGLQRPPPSWAAVFGKNPPTAIKQELRYRVLSAATVIPDATTIERGSANIRRALNEVNLLAADYGAKEYFFNLLISRPNELSTLETLLIINNLFPDSQWLLHKRFVDQYYNALPRLAATLSPEVLTALIEKLTPVFCSEADENRLSKFMQRNRKLNQTAMATLERLFAKNRQCIKVKKALQKHLEKFPLQKFN